MPAVRLGFGGLLAPASACIVWSEIVKAGPAALIKLSIIRVRFYPQQNENISTEDTIIITIFRLLAGILHIVIQLRTICLQQPQHLEISQLKRIMRSIASKITLGTRIRPKLQQ